MIKTLFLAGVGAAVAVLILGFVAPRDFKLERQIRISKPREVVFANVRYLQNQKQWSAWFKKDPNVKIEYEGVDGTSGFKAMWDSQNRELGKAEQEILSLTQDRLDTEIRFQKPFKMKFNSYIGVEATGETETQVTMGMHARMTYPMNAVSLIVNTVLGQQKKTEQSMDESLAALKAQLER